MKWNTQTFIQKSKELFGDKFDYSKAEYQSTKKKITLITKHKWTLKEALLTPYGENRNLRDSLN